MPRAAPFLFRRPAQLPALGKINLKANLLVYRLLSVGLKSLVGGLPGPLLRAAPNSTN